MTGPKRWPLSKALLRAVYPASSVQVQEAASHWDYTNRQVTELGPESRVRSLAKDQATSTPLTACQLTVAVRNHSKSLGPRECRGQDSNTGLTNSP